MDNTKKELLLECLKERLHRNKCRGDFTYWANHVVKDFTLPGFDTYEPAVHHRLLISKLEQIISGKTKKLMVFMPPGSAKSTYCGPVLCSHWMARFPKSMVISASAAENLALDMSRKTQTIVRNHQFELGMQQIEDNAHLWNLTNGSRYQASSAGQSLTGFRGTLLVIDDPVKNYEDAVSETKRETIFNWYSTVASTRLIQGSPTIIVMTRWHVDDLCGRLLEKQGRSDEGGLWDVLTLPAICDSSNDQLQRKIGDYLWPEYWTKGFIEEQKATLGPRDFAALYQQSPTVEGGTIFKVEKLKIVDAYNRSGRLVRAWDLASTEKTGSNDPDFTVGTLLQRKDDDTLVVLDVVRFRGGPEDVKQGIKNTADKDGRQVKISIPQDPGAGGKYVVLDLTKMLHGYNVESSPENGSKETRAMPIASQVNVGNLNLVKAPWNADFIFELQSFPNGKHDDIVDSLSRAYYTLTDLGQKVRNIDLIHMAR